MYMQLLGPYSGSHPAWPHGLVRYRHPILTHSKLTWEAPPTDGDATIRDSCDNTGLDGTSHKSSKAPSSPRTAASGVAGQAQDYKTRTTSYQRGRNSYSSGFPDIIVLEPFASTHVLGFPTDTSGGGLGMLRSAPGTAATSAGGDLLSSKIKKTKSSRLSFGSSLSRPPTAAIMNSNSGGASGLEYASTRPIIIPSPTGKYCALLWAGTQIYVIYGTDKAQSILDRGKCLSLGWMPVTGKSHNSDPSSTSIDDTSFALLIPGSRAMNTVKAKRTLGNLLGKAEEEEMGAYSPPTVVFRRLTLDTSEKVSDSKGHNSEGSLLLSLTANVDAAIKSPHALFGGPLLCITSRLKGQSAVVTSPSLEQLIADNKSDGNKLNTASITNIYTSLQESYKLYEESTGGSFDIATSINKSQFYLLKSTQNRSQKSAPKPEISKTGSPIDDGKYELVAVGPVMPCISTVQWDYSTGIYLAVLIQTRINILQYSHITHTLITVNSTDVSYSVYDVPTSLLWDLGVLYVATSQAVTMICTPTSSTATDKGDGGYRKTAEVITLATYGKVCLLYQSSIRIFSHLLTLYMPIYILILNCIIVMGESSPHSEW